MFRLTLGVFHVQTEARSVSMFRLKLGVFLYSD